MSALKAIVFPGFVPFKIPTTPVWATSVKTSIPKERICSATFFDVLNSLLDSSGF